MFSRVKMRLFRGQWLILALQTMKRDLLNESIENLDSVISLDWIRDAFPDLTEGATKKDNEVLTRFRNMFPEVVGRLEKLGSKQIMNMTHNAQKLGLDTYSGSPALSSWSPKKRFVDPGTVWGATESSWWLADPDSNPNSRSTLLQNPI